MTRPFLGLAAVVSLALAACANSPATGVPATDVPATVEVALTQRVDAIQDAVNLWQDAGTLADAQAAAESARNLVVGPDGPGYGDADGDGVIQGESERGLLPGLTDEPGIAQAEPVNTCVEAHVLGGSWADSAARWATAQDVYDAWTPANNTMPSLPSHPQRIVGWATLTLATDSLSEALEYAGHAQIHVDVSRDAVDGCAG